MIYIISSYVPISCVSLQSPFITLKKYVFKGRGATHLEILALRAAHWDEFLDIAAVVRGDAGRESVTSCGATRRLQHKWQFCMELNCVPVFWNHLQKLHGVIWRVSKVFMRFAAGPGKGHIAVSHLSNYIEPSVYSGDVPNVKLL